MLRSLAVRAGASLPADAAAFRGEFKRDLIALGVVMLIMLAIWAVQHCGLSYAIRAHRRRKRPAPPGDLPK
jgi:hypothetical protein